MHRRTLLLTALCSPAPPVIASFSILADMTAVIGGDAVSVTALVGADRDPHEYQPHPAQLIELRNARALVENGLGLEGWMSRMARAAGFKGQRITASAGVTPRTMLDGKSRVTDPHAWQDPRNGVLYARAIAAGLARIAPAADIQSRAAAYIRDIEVTDAWLADIFAAIPASRRKIITSHDAFGYFAVRYGIEMHGIQGISTDAEPTPRDIVRLVEMIRRERIRAVFVETMTSPRFAEVLAREAGAVMGGRVYSDALSPADGPAPSYLAMFRHNATQFAKAMRA